MQFQFHYGCSGSNQQKVLNKRQLVLHRVCLCDRLQSYHLSLFTYCYPEWWEIFAESCDWHWAVHTAPAGTGRSGWSLPQSRHCHQRCLTQSFLIPIGSLLNPPLWYQIQKVNMKPTGINLSHMMAWSTLRRKMLMLLERWNCVIYVFCT